MQRRGLDGFAEEGVDTVTDSEGHKKKCKVTRPNDKLGPGARTI